jgi:hypothetical protein
VFDFEGQKGVGYDGRPVCRPFADGLYSKNLLPSLQEPLARYFSLSSSHPISLGRNSPVSVLRLRGTSRFLL